MDLPLLLGLTFIIGLISVESFVLFWPFWLALLMKFLILSATYESYITSTTILLTVPLAILGSLLFVKMRSMNINIFSQVGLLMLIGLAAKNAILVVEVADQAMARGLKAAPAALEAAKSRFRPILMTSIP